MNTFNIHRFVQTVKWTELTLLSRTLRQTLVTMLGCFLLTLACTHVCSDNWGDSVADGVKSAGAVMLAFTLLMVEFYGAFVLGDVKRNQDRLFLMMLPASNAEKFWARVFHVTVVTALTCVVAIVGADALQALFHLMMQKPVASLTVSTFTSMQMKVCVDDTETLVAVSATSVLFFFWIQSVYLLGGMFFRKSQWLLVTLIGVVVSALVGTAVTYGSISLAESGALDGYVLDLNASAYLIIAVLAAFIVLNYWLAYKVFSRIQLINNKWINV